MGTDTPPAEINLPDVGGRARETSPAASRTDLPLAVSAKTISLLGDEMAVVALVLKLQSSGAGPGWIAALLIAALVPLVVLAPVVGRVVDTRDSRLLLVTTSAAQAVVCVVLAWQSSWTAILVLICALGVGQAVSGATWQALLPRIAGKEGLSRALGLSQSAATLASVGAPAAAGVLSGYFGTRLPLLINAGTFVVVAIGALFISARHGTDSAERTDADALAGAGLIRRDALLRTLLTMLAVFVALGSMVNVVDVFLIRETLHASATWYGFCGALFAAGILAGAVGTGRLKSDGMLARAFVGSAVGLALALAAMAVPDSVYWLLPVVFAVGVGNGVLNVALGTLVMGRAPEQHRGRIAAAMGGVASAAQIGAYLVAGALAVVITPRTIFLAAGALGLLAPLFCGRALVRAADAVPTEPTASVSGEGAVGS